MNTKGMIDNPLTLSGAFAPYGLISPGHTVYLRSGTYSGTWINRLSGTYENPITVMPYNHERVILNGGFADANSHYVTYIDIEFTTERDPNPPVYSLNPGFDTSGEGIKLINCTLHDSVGAAAWDDVDLVYGCISYNHGVIVSGSHLGHSLYTQNQTASHKKIIQHSFFGRSSNYSLHGYATNFNLTNFFIIENVLLPNSTHLIGSQKSDDGVTFNGNHVYGIVEIGYGAHVKTNVFMSGSILYCPSTFQFPQAFQLNKYLSGNIFYNTMVVGQSGATQADLFLMELPTGTMTITIDHNTYYNRTGKAGCFTTDQVPPYWMDLATRQSMYGWDIHSTIALDGSSPSDSIHVYPNEYAEFSKRKGMFVIWNWTQAGSVNVDVSSIPISAGASYRLLQAQDPLNDVRTGTMPANHILSISMTGTVASVSGWPDPPSTAPTFLAFMIESP